MSRCALRAALAALLVFSIHAQAALAPEIAETVARIATNRATARALDTQLENLREKRNSLQAHPDGQAAAIAATLDAIVAKQAELDEVTARLAVLTDKLATQRSRFLEQTSVTHAQLATHIDALRQKEERRAWLQRRIAVLKSRLTALAQDPVQNASRIEQRNATLAAREEELASVQAEIATARQQFEEFELSVSTTSGGSAHLTWSVPTTREDGSPLAAGEIAGYEIYVLGEATGETRIIQVNNALATSHTVKSLAPGTYHFSMAAMDASGHKSALSAVVSKTIAP